MTEKRYNPVARIPELEREHSSEGGMRSDDIFVGARLELTRLGCVYTEVAPGETSCPYHVHHGEDEMFVILGGEGEYRFGGKLYQVKAGDVMGAPMGGHEYAHQLFNTGTETLRYLVVSSKAELDFFDYPDSGKFMVSSRPVPGTARRRFRYDGREETRVDYFDGENIGDEK